MATLSGNRLDKHGGARLAAEVATAGREDLMEAMVAACAIVAHADGTVSAEERRRVVQLMQALPDFAGFSREAVAAEFLRHEIAFAQDPSGARTDALEAIRSMRPNPTRIRMLLAACQHVLEADGVHHPAEYEALHDIGKTLGAA